jgi:hypothetical protein
MAQRGEGIDRGTAGWPRGRGGCSAAVVVGTGRGCAGLEDALAPVGLAGSRPGGRRKECGRRREERRFRVGRRGGRLARVDWRGMAARGQTRGRLAARVGLGWVRVGVARLAGSSRRGTGASSRLGGARCRVLGGSAAARDAPGRGRGVRAWAQGRARGRLRVGALGAVELAWQRRCEARWAGAVEREQRGEETLEREREQRRDGGWGTTCKGRRLQGRRRLRWRGRGGGQQGRSWRLGAET